MSNNKTKSNMSSSKNAIMQLAYQTPKAEEQARKKYTKHLSKAMEGYRLYYAVQKDFNRLSTDKKLAKEAVREEIMKGIPNSVIINKYDCRVSKMTYVMRELHKQRHNERTVWPTYDEFYYKIQYLCKDCYEVGKECDSSGSYKDTCKKETCNGQFTVYKPLEEDPDLI